MREARDTCLMTLKPKTHSLTVIPRSFDTKPLVEPRGRTLKSMKGKDTTV